MNLHKNSHAFAAWAGITLAGASVSFGLVAATGNLATASVDAAPQAWESSHTVESLATPLWPTDVQRVCIVHSAGDLTFHTTEYLCSDFMDAVELAKVSDKVAQWSDERCATDDGWGEPQCELADWYENFQGTHDDWTGEQA